MMSRNFSSYVDYTYVLSQRRDMFKEKMEAAAEAEEEEEEVGA